MAGRRNGTCSPGQSIAHGRRCRPVCRDQLIASGRLEPAKNAFQLPKHRQVGQDGTTGSAALADQRQERHT
jgi:hypothetical protein